MSTKTTFKRVALVAVASMGFGVLTSVAPASALTTEYVTSITSSNATAPVAGAAGAAVITTVTFKTSTTVTTTAMRPTALLISKPATSALAYDTTADGTTASGEWEMATSSGGSTSSAAADVTIDTLDTGGTANNLSATGTAQAYEQQFLQAYYDVAGTYKFVMFDDLNADSQINGAEFSQIITIVVADGTAAITGTVAAHNATSGAASTYGSLVKISLKDAAGNAANVDSAGGVKVTISGSGKVSYVNTTDVTDVTSYILGRTAFDGSGNAWINVTNAEAEVVTVTLSGVGSTTVSGNVPSLTFVATAGTTSAVPTRISTGSLVGAITSNAADYKTGASVGLKTTGATTAKDDVNITDSARGTITGKASAAYSIAVAGAASGTNPGSFSIATGSTAAGQAFTVDINGGTALTLTSAASSMTGGTIAIADYTRTVAKASANSFTITVKDNFGSAKANVSVTPSLSATSRNYGLVTFATLVTDASGKATLAYTDASTSTTNMSDTLDFTATVTATNAAVITYTADATLGISTRLITSNDTDALGVAKPVVTPVAISTGDGVEAGTSTVSLTLKNAAGTLLSGVPVTWSVAGTTAAMALPTTMTTYSTAGVATADVYAWATGTYTVTATSGGVASTVKVTFASTTPESARIVSATVAGAVVTAKVVDRLGNPVVGVALTAKSTGGYFGTGSTTASCTGTGDAGTCDFVLLGGSGDVTVSASKTAYPQTIALKDSQDTDAADVYTATVAATATAAATGVGATFAPAGVNSVTVNVTGADTTASAATDAAAEATDAANAATDAANAAAEAADAATAAAQDAADAVAALSAQVSTMMASLKAQLTALTNLVIKIQKKVKA